MVVQDQDMDLAEAPYAVEFTPEIGGTEGSAIWPWFNQNETTGRVRTKMLYDANDHPIGWTFHFTNANTAFWFKMRFG